VVRLVRGAKVEREFMSRYLATHSCVDTQPVFGTAIDFQPLGETRDFPQRFEIYDK
jgi:hypothetical protein